jgi:hypothetical protein
MGSVAKKRECRKKFFSAFVIIGRSEEPSLVASTCQKTALLRQCQQSRDTKVFNLLLEMRNMLPLTRTVQWLGSS